MPLLPAYTRLCDETSRRGSYVTLTTTDGSLSHLNVVLADTELARDEGVVGRVVIACPLDGTDSIEGVARDLLLGI